MRIRIYILGLLMLVLAIGPVSAQDDDKPAPFKRPESSYARDTVNPDSNIKSLQPKKKFDIGKMLIEPNIQLYFASNYYQFGLMPSIGYKTWKNLYLGGSINYNLTYIPNYAGTNISINQQVYGGGPFAHYKIWKGFFARLRLEMLAVRYPTNIYGTEVNYNTRGIPYLWMGGGYNLTASKNFFIPLAVYINPLKAAYSGAQQEVSPYQSIVYFQIAFYIISPK